jgi:predicted transcriptional regulator
MLARLSKPKAKRPEPDTMIATGIRLPRGTKAALDEIAQEEGRSFSNLVQRALEEWLRERGVK